MERSIDKHLSKIIEDTMGNRSLELFLEFHRGESIVNQYKGAREVFVKIFGTAQAEEFLKPVITRLELKGAL